MRRPVFFIAMACLAVLGMLWWTPNIVKVQNPKRLLDKTAHSLENVSYVANGTTRVLCNGKALTCNMTIYHMKPNRTRIEYSSEPLKGVVAGDDGTCSWRCDPRTKRTIFSASASGSKCCRRLDLLLANHQVTAGRGGKVAGRPAMLITLSSASGQPRKRLWVDKSTFVILKTEDYDADGRVDSSTAYRSIRYVGSLPSTLFKRPSRTDLGAHCADGGPVTEARLAKIVGFKISKPGYLPEGYKLDGYRVYNCRCGMKAACIRYTNGLDGISVFEYRRCSMRMENKGMNSPCRIMESNQGEEAIVSVGDRTVVVVGDIGHDEAERMAKSFK